MIPKFSKLFIGLLNIIFHNFNNYKDETKFYLSKDVSLICISKMMNNEDIF
jgi:hypothetical protein